MKFTLGQILSVTHDKLMCEIGQVYEILNFLTGDNLFTHQLPRACRFCKPFIFDELPFLMKIQLDHVNPGNYKTVLDDLEAEYGGSHDLPSYHKDWMRKNPIDEAVEMVGKEKVIPVVI